MQRISTLVLNIEDNVLCHEISLQSAVVRDDLLALWSGLAPLGYGTEARVKFPPASWPPAQLSISSRVHPPSSPAAPSR
ncbi:hypothetical protein PoB_005149800 [Plakobranchus ocellatus]|uniref:Uncharacterized protein n=1 Tax=Plakobranchus ocellatus TaxID=259542 RepID=A0AAV4C0Q3_9GAST|nr:hypothetical protein PoB_005149800 [Plakobranchus ocellatus]